MRKSDTAFYAGWISILILFGVWMLVWALGVLGMGDSFMLWLLSVGIMLVAMGGLGVTDTRREGSFLIGVGLTMSVFMFIMLAVASDLLGGFVGAALGIILIGIVGLLLLFRSR